jgi:hypothetical protein
VATVDRPRIVKSRMPDTPPDSRIEKWRRWLDPRIDTEILTMHAHRDVYLKVVEITQQHGSLPPSHFFDYLASWYGTTQTAAIRRQADTNPRVVSLARLMTERSRTIRHGSHEIGS